MHQVLEYSTKPQFLSLGSGSGKGVSRLSFLAYVLTKRTLQAGLWRADDFGTLIIKAETFTVLPCMKRAADRRSYRAIIVVGTT